MTIVESVAYYREQAAVQRAVAEASDLGGVRHLANASAEAWDRLAERAQLVIDRAEGRTGRK